MAEYWIQRGCDGSWEDWENCFSLDEAKHRIAKRRKLHPAYRWRIIRGLNEVIGE